MKHYCILFLTFLKCQIFGFFPHFSSILFTHGHLFILFTYTSVKRCNLLPLLLRDFSILQTSYCWKWGPWENNGNALAHVFLLVSKQSVPCKFKNMGTFFYDICWSKKIERAIVSSLRLLAHTLCLEPEVDNILSR